MKLAEVRKRATLIWSEDECAPDAERINAALDRLFGDRLGVPILVEDHGDAFVTLYPLGVVVTAGPPRCGWTDIRQLPNDDPSFVTVY